MIRRGRRGADELRSWAEDLYRQHGPAIAELMGRPEPPPIAIEVTPDARWAAWTSGRTVGLNARWFAAHPDDVGGCLHEFAHAVMLAPVRDERTGWLIEGIADYVRDALGFDAAWTFAHHERGKALAGYQTTAHFLFWLERRTSGVISELARRLSDGRYEEGAFAGLFGPPLEELVVEYEADSTDPS